MLRANQSFEALTPSGPVWVKAGTIVDDNDPIAAGRGDLFVPVVPTYRSPGAAPVEQATAAPGERRTATRSRKAKATAAADDPAED